MYPKDFFASTEIKLDPGLCFVLMPFSEAFSSVWQTIHDTAAGPSFNLLCRRAKDRNAPGDIMQDVLEDIARARVVIADLTGQNPNVFYELGIAHTVKASKWVILLAQDQADIPFDLRHRRNIVYEGSTEKLASELSATLDELKVRQYALSLAESEVGRVPARLSGDDQFLYEAEIRVDHIGDDGVKFWLWIRRLAAGEAEPEEVWSGPQFLGDAEPVMPVPKIPWSLCFKRPSADTAHFILGRPPGWEPPGS